MKRKEQALLYGFNDEERIAAVRRALDKLGIAAHVLPPEAHHQKVGYLIGSKGFRLTPEDEDEADFVFPHEVLLLDKVKGKRLDEVLEKLAAAVQPPIRYKTVVTPFNTFWTLRRLCETMQKEHAYLAERDVAKAKRKQQKEA